MFKKGSYNVKKAEKKSSTEPKLSTSTKAKTSTSTNPKTSTSTNPKPSTSTNSKTSTSTNQKTSTMTLKKKAEIKNVSNQESPEYRKKSHPKTVTTNKRWVENKTFNPK